jgi:hypothetical protein
MDDLISRRAAIKTIDDLPNCYNGFSDTYDKACIIGVLEELPTIDPVKRGKWESDEFLYTTGQTICSACKTGFYIDDLLNVGEGAQEFLPNYCPHCGAMMEQEGEK